MRTTELIIDATSVIIVSWERNGWCYDRQVAIKDILQCGKYVVESF